MAEKKTKTEQKAVRTMPNNIEAEAYVLGAIMIDDKAANDVVPELNEDDFYLQSHRYIFRAMKELQATSKPIEFISVVDQLELDGKIDEVGSASYISDLTEKTVSAANVGFYADIVKRDSLTRRVIHASNEAVQFAYEAQSGREALEHAEELVYNISQNVSDKALQPAKKALGEALAKIQAVQAGNEDTTSVKTGFKEFDRVTKGLKPGQFIIIAARPSIGKTALVLNFATNMALNGKSVAIFNMEMEAADLVRRQLAYLSQVPFFKMENRGAMSDEDDSALMNAYNRLVATKLFIDDYSMNRPSDILSKCRRLKRDHGLDVIVVDYLQLMETESRHRDSSRQNDVSEMSRKLKIIARTLEVPVIALSQMSRDVEKDKDKDRKPQLSDLRDSGAIEQDADIVAFLHAPTRNETTQSSEFENIELLVRKNRSGPRSEILLRFEGNTTTFREIVGGEVQQSEGNTIPQQRVEKEIKTVSEDEKSMPFAVEEPKDDDVTYVADEDAPLTDDDVPYVADEDDFDFGDMREVGDGEDLPF